MELPNGAELTCKHNYLRPAADMQSFPNKFIAPESDAETNYVLIDSVPFSIIDLGPHDPRMYAASDKMYEKRFLKCPLKCSFDWKRFVSTLNLLTRVGGGLRGRPL